jgi:hypothetical protein
MRPPDEPPDSRTEPRSRTYRIVSIVLVTVALLSTSFVIMIVVAFAMAMRSMGNK